MADRPRILINVSCAGDARYREHLRLLSLAMGKPLGILVREALDTLYGAQLSQIAKTFDRDMEDIRNASIRK